MRYFLPWDGEGMILCETDFLTTDSNKPGKGGGREKSSRETSSSAKLKEKTLNKPGPLMRRKKLGQRRRNVTHLRYKPLGERETGIGHITA